MKRGLLVVITILLLMMTACANDTVRPGGIVVRGEASPLPEVDYAALATAENLVLITASGKKYHSADCPHLKNPPIAITKEQAIEGDYTPCSLCHPKGGS